MVCFCELKLKPDINTKASVQCVVLAHSVARRLKHFSVTQLQSSNSL